MVGINLNAVFRGITLFAVAYILFMIQAPIFTGINDAAIGMNIPLAFINTMHSLGNYFCLILGLASLLYIIFAGLFEEAVVVER